MRRAVRPADSLIPDIANGINFQVMVFVHIASIPRDLQLDFMNYNGQHPIPISQYLP